MMTSGAGEAWTRSEKSETVMSALQIIGIIVLCLAMLLCLGLTVFSVPGNWLILVLAVLAGAVEGFQKINLFIILALLALALLGELLEYLVGYAGARAKGASRWASLAAIISGIAGAFLLAGWIPIVGALIGAFAGAFLGAFLAEFISRGKPGQAYKAGVAAMFGRLGAILSKLAMGAAMIAVVIYRLV